MCYQFGDTDGALLQYTKAVMIDPRSGEAWSHIGNCKHKQKNFSEALAFYKNAAILAPADLRNRYAIAEVFMSQAL